MPQLTPRTRRSSGVVFAILLILGVAQPTLAAPSPDPLAIGAALNYRTTFGYSTDLSLVTALEADSDADRTYSVPLAPDELADMNRRMAIQEALPPLLEYGRTHEPIFGGMWVDQAAGGVVHFGFTQDASIHRPVLESLAAPIGATVQVDEVAWTESELNALTEVISRDLDFHGSLGVTVYNTAAKIARNSVEVSIDPYSADAARAFEDRFGPATVVLPGTSPQTTACTNRDNCPGPPIRAGISNDGGCTVGFGIYMDGNRRFLTAGHCVYDVVTAYGWGGWTWFHQSTNLGLSTDHSWFDWSAADAGAMGNVPAGIHSNDVLNSIVPLAWTNITSGQPGGNQDWEGMGVCQSGQTSFHRCGAILGVNETPYYGKYGFHIKWQRKANYMVQDGDSGAPVKSKATPSMAVGLQSGRDSLYVAYYSHISAVLMANGANGGIGASLWVSES